MAIFDQEHRPPEPDEFDAGYAEAGFLPGLLGPMSERRNNDSWSSSCAALPSNATSAIAMRRT